MAFHLGSLWLHQVGTDALLGSTREAQLAEQLAGAKRAVAELPQAERDRTAHALSSASLDIHWTPQPTVRLVDETSPRIEALRARLVELVPDLDVADLRLGYAEEGTPGHDPARHQLLGAIPLPDGSWLNFSAALFRSTAPEHATLASTTAMGVGILLLGLVVVRLIGRPLRALSEAADRIGGSGPSAPVAEVGPREIRHAAQAFNRMQARIDTLIADRTQALAAVSHDLRTPIARLRLRAGFLEDTEAARAIDADLDEMEAMISSTLAYLRGETESEKRRPADLVAMLETLCDAAVDAGAAVSFQGPPQARLVCSPVLLKRAFANLIDNAVKYGGAARVALEDRDSEAVVAIEDDGPGIPEAEMDAVFEPFRRLEQSRNRGTGGSGLGLTIARRAVESHGGTVVLANRLGGGLVATVRLPRSSEHERRQA
ncbi:two-component sensor histidine kinase [Falsiroseomonas bella]|uniref:histidine kinase n=2 Tax=Falsiroseomonas bella TaxID=2184016 RepID=A0A317F5Q2_9PROT|nr:two-component sensor histidine kinase [Falsiroseomonas bella]